MILEAVAATLSSHTQPEGNQNISQPQIANTKPARKNHT